MSEEVHLNTASLDPRVAALRSYGILDTPRESEFDELVVLAARICGAPISVVNLIEDHRQWFKAEVGLGIRETALDVSICRHMLLQPGVTVIADLRDDPRMCANPLVTAESGLRFYAGCLLQTSDGHGLGTLCILDRVPRQLSDEQLSALKTLANQVMTQLELRRALAQKAELLEQKDTLLKEVNHRTKNNLQMIIGLIHLQRRRLTDLQARNALADISARIASIAKVHEKLYQADHIDKVDAASYLSDVIEATQATAPGHKLNVKLDHVVLSLDRAIALALIVNELVTNSLKYAYVEGTTGTTSISLQRVDNRVVLSVSDQGCGLPAGFDYRKCKSLGMTIISSLARQLEADVMFVNNHPGLKCAVVFNEFPVAHQAGI